MAVDLRTKLECESEVCEIGGIDIAGPFRKRGERIGFTEMPFILR